MTNTTEYLLSSLVFIVIFTAASAELIRVINPVIQEENRRNLQSTADRLMVNMFQYTGYPSNWGDLNIPSSQIQSIGLALSSTDDTVLNLDIDKITRLSDNSYGGYIDSYKVNSLLNLENGYDFNVKFTPALNITITPTGHPVLNGNVEYNTSFNIVVTTHDLIKVPNVNLTVYMVVAKIENDMTINYTNIGVRQCTTASDGSTNINYSSTINQLLSHNIALSGSMLMVYADYYGLRAMMTYSSSNNVLKATIIGSYVMVQIMPDYPIPVSTMVEGTYAGIFNATFIDVTNQVHSSSPWITSKVYQVSYLANDAYFLAFVIKYKGNYYFVIANRAPTGTIGDSVPNIAEIVDIRRLVVIDEVYYYIDLRVWKTSSVGL